MQYYKGGFDLTYRWRSLFEKMIMAESTNLIKLKLEVWRRHVAWYLFEGYQ